MFGVGLAELAALSLVSRMLEGSKEN